MLQSIWPKCDTIDFQLTYWSLWYARFRRICPLYTMEKSKGDGITIPKWKPETLKEAVPISNLGDPRLWGSMIMGISDYWDPGLWDPRFHMWQMGTSVALTFWGARGVSEFLVSPRFWGVPGTTYFAFGGGGATKEMFKFLNGNMSPLRFLNHFKNLEY